MARSITEARNESAPTVFLCHSHIDRVLVEGLVTLLSEAGWRAYVDWADPQMPSEPTRETAKRIQKRIVDLDYFFFLATSNSMRSRWCPWELGYADGMKPMDRIVVCPTKDGSDTHGNEYLRLYRRLEYSDQGKMGVWDPGDSSNGVLVEGLR